jgi:hypothetical protein
MSVRHNRKRTRLRTRPAVTPDTYHCPAALMSIGDVADALGITRSQVQRGEQRALEKMRTAFSELGITGWEQAL